LLLEEEVDAGIYGMGEVVRAVLVQLVVVDEVGHMLGCHPRGDNAQIDARLIEGLIGRG